MCWYSTPLTLWPTPMLPPPPSGGYYLAGNGDGCLTIIAWPPVIWGHHHRRLGYYLLQSDTCFRLSLHTRRVRGTGLSGLHPGVSGSHGCLSQPGGLGCQTLAHHWTLVHLPQRIQRWPSIETTLDSPISAVTAAIQRKISRISLSFLMASRES